MDGDALSDGQRNARVPGRVAWRAGHRTQLAKGECMLTKGPVKRVTVYVNENTRHHMQALHDSILTFLMHKGISGATATRAFSGFGAHQRLHSSKVEALAEHLPVRIEFIDTAENVDEVLPTLYEMVSDGLIEV